MSLLNGSAVKAREVIDFCMASESPELKAKVFEIVSRSGLEPNDPMFMALLLTGQMRVLIEAAPEGLNRLLSEWKQESANSLSEISSTISLIKKTQIEQAEAIEKKMQAISNKCVSDIKEAGMGTVGAIADASGENYERLQENKKQIEELSKTINALQAEAIAERKKNIKNMNALIGWVEKTTNEFKLTNQQTQDSYSELRKLQQKTFWFKSISWYFPLMALFIMGGFGFLAGGWLTNQKYNTFEERYGRNIFNWNKDRLIKCENDDNPKCTFWIVPPDSPERNE
jgi:nitrate reductase NapE component